MLKDNICISLSAIFVVLYVGTEREENNNNESQEETRTSRSPNEALDEIRRQQTHNLYCPKCKTNITKSAELVVKNQETDSYKTKAYVLWVPLVISPFEFPTLHLLLSFLTGKPFTYTYCFCVYARHYLFLLFKCLSGSTLFLDLYVEDTLISLMC